jgi:hypothetical protein
MSHADAGETQLGWHHSSVQSAWSGQSKGAGQRGRGGEGGGPGGAEGGGGRDGRVLLPSYRWCACERPRRGDPGDGTARGGATSAGVGEQPSALAFPVRHLRQDGRTAGGALRP